MAVNVGGIYFSAELDDSPLKKSIKDIENSIRLMSGSVATNVNKSAQSFNNLTEETKKLNVPLKETSSLFKSMAQAVSAMGLTTLASSVINTTAKFEKYQAVLTNTYQSSDKAAKSFAFIKEFAASTPFSVDELTSSFIKFLNRGLEPTKESLTAFGDIAASQGKSFDQFTEAVLDATSGGGFERLKEFGIQASQAGDKVSLSFKNQTVVVDKNNKAIEQALINFGKMPGVADSMASVSKTTEGAFSNLGDAMDSLKVALGNVFLPLVKDIVIGLSSIVTSVKNFIEGLSPLGSGVLRTVGILAALVVGINGLVGALGLLGVASTTTGALMLAAFNPVTGAIALTVAGVYSLIKGLDAASQKAQDLANKSRENRIIGMASGEITIAIAKIKELNKEIKTTENAYKTLTQALAGMGSTIQSESTGFASSIESIESAAAQAAALGLKDLSKELLQNRLNSNLAKEAIEKYKTRVEEFRAMQAATPKQQTQAEEEKKKKKKEEDPNIAFSESQRVAEVERINAVKDAYLPLGETIRSVQLSYKDMVTIFKDGTWSQKLNAGAKFASQAIDGLGQSFLGMMQANSQLAQVKFTNLTQKVDFAVNAVLNAYEKQQEALLNNINSEIQSVEDQKQALLDAETQYQIDLANIKAQFSEEEKLRNDEAYNAEVAKLEEDYQRKLEYLRLNTADEQQFAVQKALLQADLDAAKINLRQTLDKKLLDTIVENNKKLDKEQDARAVIQDTKIKDLEQKKLDLEAQKTAATAKAEQERQNLIKQTELFKWAAGRGAFNANKAMQQAQVKINMAMLAANIASGIAMSFALFGIPGAVIGGIVGAGIGVMGLIAGATSLAAINATSYPPPPMFAEGGIVGGNSFTGDQVDAKVNSREMILTTAQQAELFAMANGKNGMGTTNNIYLGGVKVESVQGGVEAIASRVSAIIRKDIYQAYGGLSA